MVNADGHGAPSPGLRELLGRFVSLGWCTQLECLVSVNEQPATRIALTNAEGSAPSLADRVALYCAAKPLVASLLISEAYDSDISPKYTIRLGDHSASLARLLSHQELSDPDLFAYATATADGRRAMVMAHCGSSFGHDGSYTIVSAPWVWKEAIIEITGAELPSMRAALIDAGLVTGRTSLERSGTVRLVRDMDAPGFPLLVGDLLPERTPQSDPAFGVSLTMGELWGFVGQIGPLTHLVGEWLSEVDPTDRYRSVTESDLVSDGLRFEGGFVRGLGARVDRRFEDSWGHTCRGGSLTYLWNADPAVRLVLWLDGHTTDRSIVQARLDRVLETILDDQLR